MELTRVDLFEAVWQSPRKKLAEEWEISASTITSACRQYEVPLPPAGYWTLISMDKPIERPSLIGLRETIIELIDPVPLNRKPPRPNRTTKPPKQSESRKPYQNISEPGSETSLRTTISAA